MTAKIAKLSLKSLQRQINDMAEEVKEVKSELADVKKELEHAKEELKLWKTTEESKLKVTCQVCDMNFQAMKDLKVHIRSNHTAKIKCKLCDEVFKKNSDLEMHIEQNHESAEIFDCNKCDKKFALKWRLKKHQDIHKNQNIKKCHYYNNKKSCPFELIGCMFEHSPSGKCKFGNSCKNKLCSFEHEKDPVEITQKLKLSEYTGIEMTEEEENFDLYIKVNFPDILNNYLENNKNVKCYYCDYCGESKILRNIEDDLNKHLKELHKEEVDSFELETITFENEWHEEFLGFFASE